MWFRARSQRWQPEGEPQTPYDRAKREWDDRLGSARVRAASWRLFALLSLFLASLCIVGMIYLGTLPKRVIEVVQVDGTGKAQFVGVAGTTWEQYHASPENIGYQLRRFLFDTRSISADPMVIRTNWLDAYYLVAGEATNILNTNAQKTNPFARGTRERVSVSIESVLPVSENTWQADWREEVWSPQGVLNETQHWRASFTVQRLAPLNPEHQEKNPLGLYITHFSWSRVAG